MNQILTMQYIYIITSISILNMDDFHDFKTIRINRLEKLAIYVPMVNFGPTSMTHTNLLNYKQEIAAKMNTSVKLDLINNIDHIRGDDMVRGRHDEGAGEGR